MTSPFTVGIDARGLFSRDPRGHVKAFINTYARLAELRPDWQFLLYSVPPLTTEARVPDLDNLKPVFLDPKGTRWLDYNRLWQDIWLPASLFRRGVAVFHATSGPMPRFASCPTVVTVHDLIPLHTSDDGRRERAYRIFQRIIGRAARVVTPSRHTADEIVATFGEHTRRKIRLIRWAPTEQCRQPPGEDVLRRVREKYRLPDQYLLVFGYENYARKNVPGIMRAYARAVERSAASLPALCIVGVRRPEAIAEYQRLAKDLSVSDRVHHLGYVHEDDVAPLLRLATALLYLSLDEGFGMPPLDAFCCDCPVIAANATSIPEVVGDAALLVNPRQEEHIASALLRLLGDAALARDLIARGRARAAAFTWEQTAETMASILEEAVGRRAPEGRDS